MKKVVFGDEAWGMCHRQWEDLWTPLAGGGSGDRIKLVSNFQLGTRKFQLPSTIGMQHQFTHPLSVSRLRAPPTIVLLVRNCVEAFLHLMFAGLLQLPPVSVSAFLYPPQGPSSALPCPLIWIHSSSHSFRGFSVWRSSCCWRTAALSWLSFIKFLDAGGCTTQHFPTVVALRLFF